MDFVKNFAGTIIAVIGGMFWVNTQIVELKTEVRNLESSNSDFQIQTLKEDLVKQLDDFKRDQKDRDKAQWEAIQHKKDK